MKPVTRTTLLPTSSVTTVTPRPWPEFTREILAAYAGASKATRGKLRQVLMALEGLGCTSTDQSRAAPLASHPTPCSPCSVPSARRARMRRSAAT